MDDRIPHIDVRPGSLHRLIPDSPFLRLGNQLRLVRDWRNFTRDLPTTPDATHTETDRKETGS